MSDLEAEPTCPRHPGTVAYVRCQRCDRPTCPDCQRAASVGVLCVDCLREQQSDVRKPVSRLGLPVTNGAPAATITIIVVNIVAYGVGSVADPEHWQRTFGFAPSVAASEPWRWITSAFVHLDPLHLGLNMVVLFMFGRYVEPLLGRARYLWVYLGSVVGADLAIMALSPANIVHAGASGAIMGVIAAYILVAARLGQRVGFVMVQAGAWIVAGFFISGVSWQGHLGGAAAGAGIAALILTAAERRRRGSRH